MDNHMCIWCSWKPEARVRAPGTRVPDPCDRPGWCWKCGFDFSLEEVSALNYGSSSLAPYFGILNNHLQNRRIKCFLISNFLQEACHPTADEALSWKGPGTEMQPPWLLVWSRKCNQWQSVAPPKGQGLEWSQWWPYLVPDTDCSQSNSTNPCDLEKTFQITPCCD